MSHHVRRLAVPALVAAGLFCAASLHAAPVPGRVVQPVQEYFLPVGAGESPFRSITHLGTDCGTMGPGERLLTWERGCVLVDLTPAGSPEWAGMWHSLDGLASERERSLDLARCYPSFIRDDFQPRCVGVTLRASGRGALKIELKSADEKLLWVATQRLEGEEAVREYLLPLSPEQVGRAKILTWVADRGTRATVDSLGLLLEMPDLPLPKRAFLASYAKLARCYLPEAGLVKDRAHAPAGAFECVPTSGLFCLATAAAWDLGMVERGFALETLRKVRAALSRLPRAHGLLPHFVHQRDGAYTICTGTEYSTIDTSLAYHGLLLAAEILSDRESLGTLEQEVGAIRFEELRDPEGWILHGLKEDGRTKLPHGWRGWGGEAALALLLERMAAGGASRGRMERTGQVYDGVGFIAEVQSLFYPHFAEETPDAVSGVSWRRARLALLDEQRAAVPRESAAGRLGLYGFSAGEGPRGIGYVAHGTRTTPRPALLHPHYLLMSAALRPAAEAHRVLEAMEQRGLFPPWGMVENVTLDLKEYLPMLGSLNASFECLGAYHLHAQAAGAPDRIYEAARACPPTARAVRAFYP